LRGATVGKRNCWQAQLLASASIRAQGAKKPAPVLAGAGVVVVVLGYGRKVHKALAPCFGAGAVTPI
jgi:hypothetical protein